MGRTGRRGRQGREGREGGMGLANGRGCACRGKESVMRRIVFGAAFAAIVVSWTPTLLGFCGFYVSKADTRLFNKASQVVLVRDGDRTVMTLVNDFKGSLKEFAVVIPVPTFLRRE